MRIEAQGKYLQAILEKAQKSLSFELNSTAHLEETRAQLTDFNLTLSGLMENVNHACEDKSRELGKAISHENLKKTHNVSGFQLYQDDGKDTEDVKFASSGGSHHLDLNIRGGYDLFSGTIGSELDLRMHLQGR